MFEPHRKNYSEVPYIPWKGKTFSQITSAIRRNNPVDEPMRGKLLFIPRPLKHYRREIGTKNQPPTNERISAKIDLFDRPNGYLVVDKDQACNCDGIENTLDINLTSNKTERPGTCSGLTENVCLDPATNARRRVRSAGMFRQKINYGSIPEPYCTTSQQYLATRGRTFDQNQYNYLRKGNAAVKPGAPGSEDNIYAVNQEGVNYCPNPATNFVQVQYKPNNYKFAQEGAVSSSARTLRLNYNTITTNGGLFSKAYGAQVGTALSYGVSSEAYTEKDKIGVPAPCVPKFSKYSEGFQKCSGPLPHQLTGNAYAALG
jgi:hypothetical protein